MKKTEEGRRAQRVQKEVMQIISRFLMGTFKGDLPGILTVTRVTMPADLRQARVEVSILNGTTEQNKEAAKMLQHRSAEIQRYLADHLPLRYTPKLQFFADQSLEKVLKIDRILHEMSAAQNPTKQAPDQELDESDEDES